MLAMAFLSVAVDLVNDTASGPASVDVGFWRSRLLKALAADVTIRWEATPSLPDARVTHWAPRANVMICGEDFKRRIQRLSAKAICALGRATNSVCRPVAQQHSQEMWTTIHALQLTTHYRRRGRLMAVGGRVDAVFVFLVWCALTQIENGRMRECVQCQRLFLKQGRRKHCSDACRIKMVRLREEQRGPRARAAQDRTRYEKRVQPAKPQRYATRRQR